MEPEPSPDDARDSILEEGRQVLLAAARSLRAMADGLDDSFVQAVDSVLGCGGKVVTTGIGKAGHVAAKLSATLASTGTSSLYLHPSDALHGDLGRVRAEDVVLLLSNSGASRELVELLPPLRSIGAKLVAVTAEPGNPIALEADVSLCFGRHDEAGTLGLAPTTSTTAMQALGDALAMAVLSRRAFSPAEFARYHPGGALGRSLLRVVDVMRTGERNPVASQESPLSEVLRQMSSTPGRPGATSLVDADGKLTGFYTDGDFRRQIEEARGDDALSFFARPIHELMTRRPKTIAPDRLAHEGMRTMREAKIDQLPVVDSAGRPIGLLDVQDLLDVRVLG